MEYITSAVCRVPMNTDSTMPNCTSAMTTEPPPFVFKSILPHVVLAIVLVVLLVTHFVHHHFNYTLRKHHRPSAVVEDADDVDDEADPKGSKTSKMVMVVSPMKTRSDKPVASGSESVNDKALYSSRIEVMAYAAPLHRNVTEERPEDDDTSVTDTEEVITATKRHSGQNGKLSTQSVQSGGYLGPTSGSVSQSTLSLRMGSVGFVDTVQGR